MSRLQALPQRCKKMELPELWAGELSRALSQGIRTRAYSGVVEIFRGGHRNDVHRFARIDGFGGHGNAHTVA